MKLDHGKGEDRLRDIDFFDEIAVTDEAGNRGGSALLKEVPQDNTGKQIGGVILGRHLENPGKNHVEHKHHEQRVQDNPKKTED